MIRASAPAAAWVDRKLPHRLQMFVGLYGTWFHRIEADAPQQKQHIHHATSAGLPRGHIRRHIAFLFIDSALLIGFIVGAVLNLDRVTTYVVTNTHLAPDVARWSLITITVFACTFLCFGILRVTLAFSTELARRAFPLPPDGKLDFANAPRSAMIVALRLMMIVVIGLPVLAITQPFIPLFRGSALLVGILAVLAFAFWRSVANLHGHARAGAEVILLALSRQMADEVDESAIDPQLDRIRKALPGLGEPVAIRMSSSCVAVGKTLAAINLRGITGATILAIGRGGQDVLMPAGREVLAAGDTLFVAGTHRAVAAAKSLLQRGIVPELTS
jgi:CPA2 family monovalent cation:H+ antiporter-2